MHIKYIIYRSNERRQKVCVPCTVEIVDQLQNRRSNLQVTYAQILVEYLVVHVWMDTLNFSMYTSNEYGQSSSTVEYYHHKRKRHACIIELDSEDDEVLL